MSHSLESIGKNVAELHKGLLPGIKKADTWTDTALKFVEKSGFSVVIVGGYSVFLVWLGARLF